MCTFHPKTIKAWVMDKIGVSPRSKRISIMKEKSGFYLYHYGISEYNYFYIYGRSFLLHNKDHYLKKKENLSCREGGVPCASEIQKSCLLRKGYGQSLSHLFLVALEVPQKNNSLWALSLVLVVNNMN